MIYQQTERNRVVENIYLYIFLLSIQINLSIKESYLFTTFYIHVLLFYRGSGALIHTLAPSMEYYNEHTEATLGEHDDMLIVTGDYCDYTLVTP